MGNRPDVYIYDDYKAFLKDYFIYQKETNNEFSLRSLAKAAGVSNSYLSAILTSDKHLAPKTLEKFLPHLGLHPSEESYLKVLRNMADPRNPSSKRELLGRLQKFKKIENYNAPDADLISYLGKWFHIAIRELAARPDFRLNHDWIQKNLAFPVPKRDIVRAMKILVERKFLVKKRKDKIERAQKSLNARAPIYSVAMANLHEQFLQMAIDSLNRFSKTERTINAHVVCLDKQKLERARKIMENAYNDIVRLSSEEAANSDVFYFGLMDFPLTTGGLKSG